MLLEAKHKNLPQDYRRAKELRQRSSFAEQKLWFALRNYGKQHNLKFRRQQPIHPYIVDFACFEIKLIIELDGQSHDHTQVQDQRRANYLASKGFKVVRYANDDALNNMEGLIETLHSQIMDLASPTPPLTPPARGGERLS